MRTAQQAQQSRPYHLAITVGLIAYGVVHVLIAWIALQLAWGKTSEKASKDGALQELASKPFGGVLLWIVAVGLFALVIWKALELAYGHLDLEKKLSSIGRGAVYLTMSVSAAKMAMGSSSKGASLTENLMKNGPGRVLIVIIGLVVIGVGIRELYKAAKKKFLEDLTGGVSESTILLGRIGYAAKGVVLLDPRHPLRLGRHLLRPRKSRRPRHRPPNPQRPALRPNPANHHSPWHSRLRHLLLRLVPQRQTLNALVPARGLVGEVGGGASVEGSELVGGGAFWGQGG